MLLERDITNLFSFKPFICEAYSSDDQGNITLAVKIIYIRIESMVEKQAHISYNKLSDLLKNLVLLMEKSLC